MPLIAVTKQHTHWVLITVLLGVLVSLSVSSCQALRSPPSTDVFNLKHVTWWNFYRRGVAYLTRGDLQSAKEDFETCLGLRPGARYGMPKDMWRARTYGMHMQEGYFPHRELGITLYRMGKANDSIEFLETSLEQTQSGRGKFYLNLARRQVLKGKDVKAPEVWLDASSKQVWTSHRVRMIEGVARAEGFVQKISINHRACFVELAEAKRGFQESIVLHPGSNTVVVSVEDLLGNRTETNLTWVADWTPPMLAVRQVGTRGANWFMEVVCHDDIELGRVWIDASPLSDVWSGTGRSQRVISLEFPIGHEALFEAEDAAGNQLTCLLSHEGLTHSSQGPIRRYASALEPGIMDASSFDHQGEQVDRLHPRIRLSETRSRVSVFDDEFQLDGEIEDKSGLASLRINGEELLSEGIDRGSVRTYFSQRLPLNQGTNVFDIVVRDTAGNDVEKQLQIVRRMALHVRDEYRLTIGVPPLLDPEPDLRSEFVRNRIEQEVVREPVRFYLLEREEGWDFILREQKLSLTDLAEPRAALRIQEMLPAELLLVGSILPQDKGVTIYARVVDCNRGVVLFAEDVYSENLMQEIGYQVAGLVLKIEQRFPLLEGRIMEVKRKKVIIDVGTEKGVWLGAKFLVLHEDEHVEEGGLRGLRMAGEIPVELFAERADSETSVAKILPSSAKHLIRKGDLIYAR